MVKKINKKLKHLLLICVFLFAFKGYAQKAIPIYFSEYSLTVNEIPKLGDTIHSNFSSKEYFKFVFFNNKGKCYCERYINNKLFEKGFFENSLDTLKRYIYGHSIDGKSAPIKVQKYFQPIKNGEWFVYNSMKKKKEVYVMGILKDKLDTNIK